MGYVSVGPPFYNKVPCGTNGCFRTDYTNPIWPKRVPALHYQSPVQPDGSGGKDIAVVDNGVLKPTINDDGTTMTPAEVAQFTTQDISAHTESQGAVTLYYQLSSSSYDPDTDSVTPTQLSFEIIGDTDDALAQNSLLFTLGGKTYFDRDGLLFTDHSTTTNAGVAVGSVDYRKRIVTLDSWTGGASPGVTIHAAATINQKIAVSNYTFRTPGAPIRPESLQVTVTTVNGDILQGVADADGIIDAAPMFGTVNVETGIVELRFSEDFDDLTGASDVAVFIDNGRYNAVLFSFLPLDAEIIGLDPVRLPADGRVPIYREGDVIVMSHTAETDIGTPSAGDVETLARDHQASIIVVDSAGVPLNPDMYTANLLAGTVTFADPLTLEDASQNALTPPMIIQDRIEHMSVLNDVQITGQLSYIAPSGHLFPADETVVSSALVWGDINARVFNFFTQQTWNSGAPNWTDERIGNDTTANYNIVDNPIEFANNGAITEKWALVFTSATGFNIVGQTLGIIGQGNTSTDVAPNNPNTDNPYFVMRAAGFGSGWAAGNVIRFDQEGCLAPVWIARTVLSGGATEDDDRFVLQVRGDAD